MRWGFVDRCCLPTGVRSVSGQTGIQDSPCLDGLGPRGCGSPAVLLTCCQARPRSPRLDARAAYPHWCATSTEVHRTHLWAGFPSFSFPLEPVDLKCWLCPISRCGRADLTLQQLMGGITGLSWRGRGGVPTSEATGSGHNLSPHVPREGPHDLSPHDLREGPWELPPHAPGEGPHDLSPYVPGIFHPTPGGCARLGARLLC